MLRSRFQEKLVETCRALAKKWAELPLDQLAQLKPDEFHKMQSIEQVKVLDCIETVSLCFCSLICIKIRLCLR